MTATATEISVLHVDDEPDFADVSADFLEREDARLSVETATSVDDAYDQVQVGAFDCIVSDYDMPGKDGLDFLRMVREDDPDVPFILFTGKGSEEVASDAIAEGVTEYLQKQRGSSQYAVLANRIANAVTQYRSQRELTERTRQLETLISNVPGMVYRCRNEPGWPMSEVEGDVEDLAGYSVSELESGAVSWGGDVVHPADSEEVWQAVQESLDANEYFEVTYRIRRGDGSVRWVWERGQCVTDDGDAGEALEGFITDVHDRRENERKLEVLGEEYETIFENAADAIFLVDVDRDGTGLEFQYARLNPAHESRTGLRTDDIQGKTPTEAFGDEVGAELRANYERCVEAEAPISYREQLSFPDGRFVWQTNLAPVVVDGEVARLVGIARELPDTDGTEAGR